MNKFLQKWIDELIPEMQDGFSANQMKDRLIDHGKTLKYLENTTSIGYYLSKHGSLMTVLDQKNKRTYWRISDEN
tara:strand:- start:6556 stop:6780 length:225 start_codon:yes stop_codon:yes gene_type:complete